LYRHACYRPCWGRLKTEEGDIKSSILGALVCPVCQSPPEFEALRWEGDEIVEGFFRCRCGNEYPVIGGVPRMLPPPLLGPLVEDYPEFFRAHADRIPSRVPLPQSDAKIKRATQKAFGYEWTWAADYHAVNFGDWLPADRDAQTLFGNKVGLEVGCGAGRHAALTATVAKEHFAVDLSRAVDSAFARTRALPNCHVVQADAFHLPFRPQTFDYVYCLGVLQHLPDPEAGFYALAQLPAAGGSLLVNVYQASRPTILFLLELVRKVTTRLPHAVLKYVSVGAGCVDYGLFIAPWRFMSSTGLGTLLRPFVPERIREYTKHDFNTCVTDWFDRLSCPVKKHYKRGDLYRWYERAGYLDVAVTPYWKAFWNGYGTSPKTPRSVAEHETLPVRRWPPYDPLPAGGSP
jgi:SAM-dependent methyltransferase